MLPHSVVYRELKSVSDIIVLDFLVSDHDRSSKGVSNWFATKHSHHARSRVVLDSGLAWSRGPYTQIFSALCGRRLFSSHDLPHTAAAAAAAAAASNIKNCTKICRFSQQTMKRVMYFAAHPYTLSQALRGTVEAGVSMGNYEVTLGNRSYSHVRFELDVFFDALEDNLAALVEHVEVCKGSTAEVFF